jgi:hypothetical protein
VVVGGSSSPGEEAQAPRWDHGWLRALEDRKFKMLQDRPEIIDGRLVGTGLVLDA